MKKIFYFIAACAVMFATVSCDAIFDNLEGDLTKMTGEDLMKSENGVQGRLATLYSYIPMGAFSTDDRNTFLASGRLGNVQAYRYVPNGWWNYTQMRTINKFIEDLDAVLEKGIITQASYNTYKGEAMFVRAYCYFGGVKMYGGMPIVDRVLDSEYNGTDNAGLYIPRSTEKETWDWIIAQLDEAANLLPETIIGGELRANKYVAYALQSRVALYAASVAKYWNNKALDSGYQAVQQKLSYMDASMADAYYQKCMEASAKVINSGRYQLYGANPGSIAEAKQNLIDMFQSIKYDEYIFGRTYNTGVSTADNGIEGWAPSQVTTGYQTSTGAVTLNMVDSYATIGANGQTVKGKIQTLENGSEDYCLEDPYTSSTQLPNVIANLKRYNSIDEPFINKDARFQAWVVWPDDTFRGNVIKMQAGMINPDGSINLLPSTNDPVQFNGSDYYPYGGPGNTTTSFSAFWQLNNPNGVNSFEYCFGTKKFLNQQTKPAYTQSPWYDIRYAEILLNYAEAAAESGKGDQALAKKCLNDVHQRAGFAADLDLTVDNILNEVKCEFFAENHWQSVLHRRRAFYTQGDDITNLEGIGKKMTLLPLVDLSGAEAKWVFVRALPYYSSTNQAGQLTFRVNPDNYYQSIPNYGDNHLTNNNTK